MQHTHDEIFWTSLNGGLFAVGVDEYSSCISRVRLRERLSGRSSLISMKAPDSIFATNFGGIGVNDDDSTTGSTVVDTGMGAETTGWGMGAGTAGARENC